MWERGIQYTAYKFGLFDFIVDLWPLWLILGGIVIIVVMNKQDKNQ